MSAHWRSPFTHRPIARLARYGLAVSLLACIVLQSAGAQAATPAAPVGSLRVIHSTPSAGATDLPASSFISLTFDRPVVTLGDVGVAGIDPAATISPAVSGKGRWISTRTWAYQVRDGLALGTRYQVTTRPELVARDGARLPGAYSFSFATLRPAVLSVVPTDGTQYALPRDSVQVIFNQPVRRTTAEAAFSLTASGQPISGTFSWNGPLLATQPNGSTATVPPLDAKGGTGSTSAPAHDTVLTFRPTQPLALGAGVQVRIGSGLLGTGGPLPIATPYIWHYTIAGPLSVVSSTPANGATGIDPSSGLQITLSAPVTQARAQSAIHISPKLDYQYVSLDDKGTTITVNGDFQPSVSYTARIDTRVLGTAGQALSAPSIVRFSTQATAPSISLVTQGPVAVYNAYLGTNIYVHVVNLARIALSVYRLTGSQFLNLQYNPPSNWSGQPPAGAPLISSAYLPAQAPLNRSILVRQTVRVAGKPLPPGYYLVNAGPGGGGGGAGDHLLMLVTRTAVTLKIGQHQAFAWATDLKSGKPVSGESVRLVDNKGRVWTSGVTGTDGTFAGTARGLRADDSLLQHTLQAQLSRGGDVAACGLDWNNGVGPWDFSLPFSSYQQPTRMYVTSERPIYRPGQPVYFKGIARRDNDGRYGMLPFGSGVQVQIQDARQNTIFNTRLHVDAYGAFSGTLLLSPAAAVGSYTINAGIGVSTANTSFQVAEYKKPTYAVTVIGDRGENANYVQGQRVGVQVRARYYFGAALSHAPVKWDVTQNDFFFSSPLFPDYDFVDQDYAATQQQTFFGQQTTEGSGATDAHGDFRFSVPAMLKKGQGSQQYTLEAIVTGPDNSQVAEQTQDVVHSAALYVGLRASDYVGIAGKTSHIQLVTVADDGMHTAGGVPVAVRVYRRIWLSSFVRDASGFYYWQDRFKDTLVSTFSPRTNALGRATVGFAPANGGEYRIVATATDAAGHTVSSATPLWVVSAGEAYVPWQPQNNDRIRLVADRNSYTPGQTAHILVTAPLPGMTALITVERGGVLSHQLRVLPTNSSQVDVPIRGYYAPDVYVSVTLVKGPGADTNIPVWKIGYISLPVDTSARSLHVAITASTGRAQPKQAVTFRIHATNARGQGVQAQLAVALVDKAVLALAAASGPSLMDTFYQQRDLGVESAGSQTLYIDRLNLNQKVGSKGGSGGGGGGQGPTRQKFPDTAYWNPTVVTDAAGNATVRIVLPDNLTTWTLTAIGGTADTLVGQNSMDLISTKDLLLQPALPRFLTVSDTVMGGAVVDNLTTNSQQVKVTLRTGGSSPRSDYVATVRVPAGGSQLVQWPIRAGGIGTQTFLFAAQAASSPALRDRLLVSVPVQSNSIVQTAITSGLFRASATEMVTLPAGVQRNQGDLTVTLAPSLVSGLGGAAHFLLTYPYACAEQTTSRYYGLVELQRLPSSVSGLDAASAASVPATVQTALQQLSTNQDPDGGWGWWPEENSVPYVSAWVLDGLLLLKAQGYTVDAKVLKQAIGYVHHWALNPATGGSDYYSFDYLSGATPALDLQAYIAYLLARAGQPDSGLMSTLYGSRQNMLPFARAYLALAVAAGNGIHDSRVRALLDSVEGEAQQFDNQAHWSDKAPDWLMMEDDTAASAVILDALTRLDPSNPLTMATVRWLMARRMDGAWDNTQSTALALRALTDFARRTQPLSGTARFRISVNGQTVGSGTISDANRGIARSFSVPLASLRAANVIRLLQQGGTGQMAYTIALRSYQPITKVQALEHGIVIDRRYEALGGGHGQAGSDLRVVLTVTAPEDLYYLQIEDPLPAGAEPVDPTLRTTSVLSGITSRTTIPQGTNDLGWYVTHVELRDDRAALFADYLPAGSYQYSYQIHLTSAGTFHALPAQARELYFPDVSGHGAGSLYTISAS